MKYRLNKKHPRPLYVQLSDIIKEKIHEQVLKENDPIPSESELMEKYGISRITVRNALARLEFDGLIYKVHGRGAFVSAPRVIEIPSPARSFREQAIVQGFSITRKLIEFTSVYPPDGIKERLGLQPEVKVGKIKRLIKMDRTNIGLDVLFVPQDIGRALHGLDLSKVFLIDHLNKNPETRILKMDLVVRASPIEELDAEAMGVDHNNTVLVRACTYWSRFGRAIMAGKVVYLSQYTAIGITVDSEKQPLQFQVGDVYQHNTKL
jgi:GntR family transcriptional regulator